MFSRLVWNDFSVGELLKVCSLALGGACSLILIALNSLVVSAGAGEPPSLAVFMLYPYMLQGTVGKLLALIFLWET